MKKKSNILIFALILICLVSCLKQDDNYLFDGKIQIKGKVLDDYTHEGVPDVIVKVDGISSIGFMGGTRKEVGRTITNENGEFSTTIHKIKDPVRYDFIFLGNEDFYIPGNRSNISEEMLIENGMDLDFPAYKLTDFVIELKKTTNADVIDTIRVSWGVPGLYFGAMHGVLIEGDEPYLGYMWKGNAVRATIRTKSVANRETDITWALKRNGTLTYKSDTIICERDVENIFTLEY